MNANPAPDQPIFPMTAQYYLAELALPAETTVLVCMADFNAALCELVPSVTQSELDHYAHLQRQFAHASINGTAGAPRDKGKGKATAQYDDDLEG